MVSNSNNTYHQDTSNVSRTKWKKNLKPLQFSKDVFHISISFVFGVCILSKLYKKAPNPNKMNSYISEYILIRKGFIKISSYFEKQRIRF